MLRSILVLLLHLLVLLTPDLRIKNLLLQCNWTIRHILPMCKSRLQTRERTGEIEHEITHMVKDELKLMQLAGVVGQMTRLIAQVDIIIDIEKWLLDIFGDGFFFLNDPAPPNISPLPLPDPFPI